jgi:uncharacterized glyoxalase superfamily protein PhnB
MRRRKSRQLSIPKGYHSVTPYLIAADASGLIAFIEQAFGAQVKERLDGPDGSVWHAELKIGDSIVMLSQASEKHPALPAMLHVYVEDCDTVYRRGIAAGGEPIQEPKDQFYGDRSGGFRDSSGNQWWVATHVEDVSKKELEIRQ